MIAPVSPWIEQIEKIKNGSFENKSADLAREFYGMISEPGAKTLAWPGGRRGGSAGEGGRGGGSMLFYSGVPGGPDSPLGTKFYA